MSVKKWTRKLLREKTAWKTGWVVLSFLLFFFNASPCFAKSQPSDVTWKVTQYGEDSDRAQSMFYTIKGSNGRLIVIDGGWGLYQQRVRNVINELGGKVDLWIITHPHPDHVGALNKILENPGGIKISRIYAPKINSSRYNRYKQPWDEYPVYTKFMNLMKRQSRVKWLKDGDEFKFYGLKFRIFNGYSRNISDTTKDICNGSSLVFKISGKKTSMLFTGDIPAKTGKRLIQTYGEELKATYLQAPHHGNNTGRNSFFKYIGANITFVDAQADLRKSKSVSTNMETIKKLGGRVYTFDSRKRSVTIK